ncbi:uncharacterized protein LOC110014028 [Oryzias latipes]|uniref:uncharacterized protein LOC110014028 n=1 Tax=Oryzias latipes TaxID=8090 RepID=UPI0009DAF56D|nr:uncharacterized protein LOC110014028 [Oryzias latipes]
MEGLQQFHSVFNAMERRFSEEQAAVYSMLSDAERENIQDIEELRCAIKREAAELERQLKELSHHYNESLQREMDSLRYEQSQLCSQVALSGTVLTSSPSHRAAAIQCSLLPWPPSADEQTSCVSTSSTGSADVIPKSPFGSVSITDSQAPSPTTEKLDILGLLHRVGKSCIQ